ncbi:MAG: NAD(P)-binding domain-containing protein [Deltaproteobacteria bacterium]|nr:NAD(P)-binding domain-containing protein [Deltaproteobacteria bacterium]
MAIRVGERVTEVVRQPANFTVVTEAGSFDAAHVLLAVGRRGSPRKLGVPGEARKVLRRRRADGGRPGGGGGNGAPAAAGGGGGGGGGGEGGSHGGERPGPSPS